MCPDGQNSPVDWDRTKEHPPCHNQGITMSIGRCCRFPKGKVRGYALLMALGCIVATPVSRLAVAQHQGVRTYLCFRTTSPVVVDGTIDDAVWRSIPWTEEFIDIEGISRPVPRFRTRVKIAWDSTFLYVAAELEEPHVWATITKRDSVIFRDNDFEVFIDPDGDNHQYYEFEINALNTGWDLRLIKPYRDGGPPVDSWNIAGLVTAVAVQGTLNDPHDADTGWSVEIAFPWKALGEFAQRPVPPRNGDQWRINFSRVEWRHEITQGRYRRAAGTKEDNWVWSPQGFVDMHRPERWGIVQFAHDRFATITPDRSMPCRWALMEVYYAQKSFFERHRAWAGDLQTLGFPPAVGLCRPSITLIPDGYIASCEFHDESGTRRRVHLREDSCLRVDEGDGCQPGSHPTNRREP